MQKCGVLDEITIYRHPVTNKHLGLARLVFNTVKGARNCVEKFNKKSVMGKVIIDKIIANINGFFGSNFF